MTEIILDEPLSPAQNSFLDDEDDESHNCRRCDLPISEGHAYELGGDRWHMYCFSCSKCSKLLGTSSNFLVLGTGDLICSECSYACNACGKKIDDLAILTGEQAYCSSCFCCRNCKKRIEDLRYARTSKGLFCMSCHEKLLEKKKKHDLEKKQSRHLSHRNSKFPTMDKSLPKIPNGGGPLKSNGSTTSATSATSTGSPGSSGDVSSDLSTPGILEVPGAVATTTKVPPRSPKRKQAQLSLNEQLQNTSSSDQLEPPVSVSPQLPTSSTSHKPRAKSPLLQNSYFDGNENVTTPSQHFTSSSQQSTPNFKNQENLHETPKKSNNYLSENTPMKQTIISPNGKNRQAVVVDSISSSSSNNILSSYITRESPPPKVPVPQLPGGDDDFIDMNDSDDDQISKYTQEPSGLQEKRKPEHIPTGLNIQGIPSLNETDSNHLYKENNETNLSHDNDDAFSIQESIQPHAEPEPQPQAPNTPNHSGIRSWKLGSANKADNNNTHNNALLSPTSPSPAHSKKSALTNITNESSGVSRTKSIRSPKTFLSFRRHKKSVSGSSIEPSASSSSNSASVPSSAPRGKYYSPMMDSTPKFDSNVTTPKFNTHTRGKSDTSPYQGAALFTTPPVPDHKTNGSHSGRPNNSSATHNRSHSDANNTFSSHQYRHNQSQNHHFNDSNELSQVELELRSLRTDIFDLKQTRNGIRNEINDLTSARDGLNLEVLQLSSKLEQLKIAFEQQQHQNQQQKVEHHQHQQQEQEQQQQQKQKQSQNSQHLAVSNDVTGSSDKSSTTSDNPLVTVISPPQDQISTAEQIDTKQKPKARFWRRGNVTKGFGNVFNKNDISSSQSSYSLSNILNDGNNNGSNNNGSRGNPQISAPLLRSEETDELGGNDNKKLINGSKTTNYIDLGSSSSTSTKSNNSNPTLIMSDLFNSTLEMRTLFEKRQIPLLISRLVKEVETRGLDSEGIYRKNGGTLQMNNILKAFNNLLGAETSQELETSLEGDINAITSSLKRYLYFILPEPIITMNVYESYIKIAQIDDPLEKIESLSSTLSQLPKANILTLSFLLKHIKKIESYQHVNKMTFHNLAVVFAPTFTRVSSGERELADMQSRNNVTEFLLVNQDKILNKIDV